MRRQIPAQDNPDGKLAPTKFRRLASMTGLLLALLTSSAIARDVQSLDSIRDTVRDFAATELANGDPDASVEVGRLDPRLRLAQCSAPLEAFRAPGGGRGQRSTVGVRCPGEQPWTLYVSVQLQSHAEVYAVTRNLARGAMLRPEHIEAVEVSTGRLTRGYFTDPEEVVGMRLRRPVRDGDILAPSNLEAPQVVERGQAVDIIAETRGSHISMRGEALSGGAAGERIRVRNHSSERIVEGEINERGQVRVH